MRAGGVGTVYIGQQSREVTCSSPGGETCACLSSTTVHCYVINYIHHIIHTLSVVTCRHYKKYVLESLELTGFI